MKKITIIVTFASMLLFIPVSLIGFLFMTLDTKKEMKKCQQRRNLHEK